MRPSSARQCSRQCSELGVCRFVDAVCDLAKRGKEVDLCLTLDRDDCVDSDQKTLACQKLLEHGLCVLIASISTVRGPDGINSFVSSILRSATTKTMLVRVDAKSRSVNHLDGYCPYTTDFRLRRRDGMLELSQYGARFERVERYVVLGVHKVDMSGMMDE